MTDIDKTRDDYFREEEGETSILRSILGLFTFSTIIPLNVYTTIDEMAKMTWFWPLINAFVGFIGVIIAFFLNNILHFPIFLTAVLVYGFFILINGCHHLDGLLDFSDAVMFQGSAEKKISIMRDSLIGTGAISSLFLTALVTISCYFTFIGNHLIWILLISEMCAKLGLLTVCVTSTPYKDGTGRAFIKYMSLPKYVLSVVICLIIATIINPSLGVFGVLGGILGGGITSFVCKRHIKVATGDVLGASNELGRMFSLLIMLIPLMSML
jgi:adenosylcobinamide-GDP ribazoletransferase